MGGAPNGYVLRMPDRMTTSDRAAPATPSAWRWRLRGVVPGVVAAVVVSVGVSALALVVQERVGALAALDESVIRAATDVTRAHPGLRSALLVWEAAFQPLNVYVVATAVCLLAWWRGGLRARAIWAFVTMMVAWNLALDLKLVVARARPVVADPVSSAPGYSFPSGHVANAAAAATVLVILLWPLLSRRSRPYAVGVAAVVVVLTALDRVYLGVHYPSDTIAGVLVGCGIAVASVLGYRGWRRDRPATPPPSGIPVSTPTRNEA